MHRSPVEPPRKHRGVAIDSAACRLCPAALPPLLHTGPGTRIAALTQHGGQSATAPPLPSFRPAPAAVGRALSRDFGGRGGSSAHVTGGGRRAPSLVSAAGGGPGRPRPERAGSQRRSGLTRGRGFEACSGARGARTRSALRAARRRAPAAPAARGHRRTGLGGARRG